MIGNIDVPRITSDDPAVQNAEIRRYLFQLVETLNFNFNDIQNELRELKGENNGDVQLQ